MGNGNDGDTLWQRYLKWLEIVYADKTTTDEDGDKVSLAEYIAKQFPQPSTTNPYYRQFIESQNAYTSPYQGIVSVSGRFNPPKMGVEQYQDAIKLHLGSLFARGEMTLAQVKGEYESAVGISAARGVTQELPFYNDIIQYAMTPEWYASERTRLIAQDTKQSTVEGLQARSQYLSRYEKEQRASAEQRLADFKENQSLAWDAVINRQVYDAKKQEQAEFEPMIMRAQRMDVIAVEWEKMRQTLLRELDPDLDWITLYELKNKQNPYINTISFDEGGEAIREARAQGSSNLSDLLAQREQQLAAEPPPKKRPSDTPPTPGFLAKAYPTQLTEGDPIHKDITLSPPGAGWWGSLLPSQRARWVGFSRFLGQSPEDLLYQSQQTAPRTPQSTTTRRPVSQRSFA